MEKTLLAVRGDGEETLCIYKTDDGKFLYEVIYSDLFDSEAELCRCLVSLERKHEELCIEAFGADATRRADREEYIWHWQFHAECARSEIAKKAGELAKLEADLRHAEEAAGNYDNARVIPL